MNVINVVQGELVMLGGFITYQLTLWGVSPLWGVPVAAIVLYFIGAGLHLRRDPGGWRTATCSSRYSRHSGSPSFSSN